MTGLAKTGRTDQQKELHDTGLRPPTPQMCAQYHNDEAICQENAEDAASVERLLRMFRDSEKAGAHVHFELEHRAKE